MIEYYHKLNDISEGHWNEAVRAIFPKNLRNLNDGKLNILLRKVLKQLPIEERDLVVESIGSIAKSIGSGIKKNAGTIGGIAGGVVGTYIGGPAGTAIGAQLGSKLGNMAAGSQPQRQKQQQKRYLQQRKRQIPFPSNSRAQTQQTTPISIANRPETRTLMLAGHAHFLIQVMQAVIESILKVLLKDTGRRIKTESFSENLIPVESFANAIAVFSEASYIQSSKSLNNIFEELNYTPKEKADAFFETLFINKF